MKKIAVLFEGDIHRRLGVFNAVISRVKHLKQVADYKIDVHMFQVYDGWLMRRIRHSKKIDSRPDAIVADGVTIHITLFRRRWTGQPFRPPDRSPACIPGRDRYCVCFR